MRSKSNKELETILLEKDKYTEEAIQAVTWELQDRNILERTDDFSDEITKETVTIDVAVTNESTENNKSPFEELEVPVLYSKKAILGFTIFFSTIFGAVLLMQNLKEMNKPKARNQVLIFGLVYTVFSTILLNYLPKSIFTTLILNMIGYTVLTGYFWNINLGKDIVHRDKQIWKILGISLLIVFGLIFLLLLTQNLEQ
ncbi:hypothetical protein [Polaribacter atrinae]|uniref:Uncharacterized protein n=2 Tax=Polaribacter atrinae TaxID=1333662 RepID=A0A176TEA1_9FLAO|nr:hypothetical protein [Polaribacter atrinae]OAD45715.1 hypothetical protein LPB303_05360 [Polaribacter atrinae]